MEPVDVSVRWELPHVAAKAVVEDDSAQNVALHEDEREKPERAGKRPLGLRPYFGPLFWAVSAAGG
jgi:hypothetical protein